MVSGLSINQIAGAIHHHLFARVHAGNQFHFVADAFAGFDDAQLRVTVHHDKNQFHLSALHHGRGGRTQRGSFAHRHGRAPELAGPQAGRWRQVKFDEKGAAVGIGGRRDFADDAIEFVGHAGHAHPQFVAEGEMADDRFRHVGFQPQIAGVLHFQQRFARRGEVAHVGVFAGDDAVERRDDFGVAEQGFRLRRRRVRHAEFGLGVVVFGLRKDFLLNQVRGAFQIVLRLLAHRQRPVELGLHFARVQLHQQLARLHILAGHHQHFFNPAADFGFDDGVQFGAHRAHHFFGGNALFVLHGLHADGGGRKVFRNRRFHLLAAAGKQRCRQQNGQAGSSFLNFHIRLWWPASPQQHESPVFSPASSTSR